MTREEAIAELKEHQVSGDREIGHMEADDILCALLKEIGYGDVVEEYHKVEKWFA